MLQKSKGSCVKNKVLLGISLLFVLENIGLFILFASSQIHLPHEQEISGVYQLESLQAQESDEFAPMAGVEILKIFADGFWISPAYDKNTKKVLSLSGGRYKFDARQQGIEEEVLFNLKDAAAVGLSTTYKLQLDDKGFYQSGIYKAGTVDAWKVEEKWVKGFD
jgi:hypothetical protein